MRDFVYVDFENMGGLKNLVKLDGEYFFFLGNTQNSIPKSLVLESTKVKINWIEIEGTGNNALDFHIAYYLGINANEKDVRHFILSKDKGFDPLIATLNKKYNPNFVKRIVSLSDISVEKQKGETPSQKKSPSLDKVKFDKLLKSLNALQKPKRPKSEKTLKGFIQSISGKEKWSDTDIKEMIEELYRSNYISKGANNRISYSK
jgi:hypothetical protein